MADEALNYRRAVNGYTNVPQIRPLGPFSADLAAIRALPETSGRDHESPREDVAYWAARVAAQIQSLPTYRGVR